MRIPRHRPQQQFGQTVSLSLTTTAATPKQCAAVAGALPNQAVSGQSFGSWNGSNTRAQLTVPDGIVPAGVEVSAIYRNDWQGNQLLYPTPRTNRIVSPTSFTGSGWIGAAFPGTITTNAAGTAPDGVGASQTCTVTTAGPAQRVQQNIGLVPNDANPSSMVTFIEKTLGDPNYTCVALNFNNGIGFSSILVLNTNTGVVSSITSGHGESYDITTAGVASNFWRVRFTANNNNTGNTLLAVQIYPTWNTDGSFNNTGPTGSKTIYGCNTFLDSSYAGVFLTSTSTPVTDYTLSGTTVNLAQAPAATATTTWDGLWTSNYGQSLDYLAINSGPDLAFVTAAMTSQEALAAAIVPSSLPQAVIPVPVGHPVRIRAGSNLWFSGLCASGTAAVTITPILT